MAASTLIPLPPQTIPRFEEFAEILDDVNVEMITLHYVVAWVVVALR